MKIVYKQPEETADISAASGSSAKEFFKLTVSALILLIGLYYATSTGVDLAVSKISFETEAKIFQAFNMSGEVVEDEESKEEYEKLKAILEVLKSNATVPPLPYEIVVMEEDTPNAFAFPGGTIGLTTGLLKHLKNEIEIAFVIGHELGHFYNRDHLRGLGRAVGFGIVMAAVFQSGSGGNSFTGLVNGVIERRYSQDRESLADQYGLELIYQSYGKIQGVDTLFKILLETNDSPEWAYMFSTHPSPKERIKNLEAWAENYILESSNGTTGNRI